MKNKNLWRRDTLRRSQNNMPKTDNSIDCPCGGYYAKKNKSRHTKTKLHQAYEEQQGKESEYYCDIHEDLLLLHDGNGGYYCDRCDEEQGL